MLARYSISRRLQLVIVLTTGAALTLACIFFILFEWRLSMSDARQSTLSIARITADASSAMLAFGSQGEAEKLLSAFRSEPHVRAAAFYDASGRLFAEYRSADAKIPTPARPGADGISVKDRKLMLFHPVIEGERRYGTLYLQTDLGRTYERLWRYGGIALLIVIGAFGASLLIGRFLERTISRPILELANTARSISEQRNYSVRARPVEGSELSVLTGAFNQMLETIQHQQSQLEGELSDRKRAETALQEADRRKDEFLATLAHELRNPLAPLRYALDMLKRSGGDREMVERNRSVMERQVNQMVRLVDDLLDVARITNNRLQLRKERIDLSDVVRSAMETARPVMDAAGHELSLSLPRYPVLVDVDPVRMAQVVSNLLNNAAKYTEKHGHIWLTAERRGDEAVVSVRDTGVGIPDERLSDIFNMFSQVTPALQRSQGGLGIGLALVRGLVELHGGRVEARSAGANQGSEFIVHLPVVDAPAPQAPDGNGDTAPSARKSRILVVDDLRDAADSLALMLEMMGHESRTAYDGLEAVQTAGAFQPNVVFLDIGLPKMNGYEAARRIRDEATGKMVLVALTGWGQEEDRQRSMQAGFDHHLTKPVEPAALERLLASMLPPG